MRTVTDEVRNPFGMRPPCPHPCAGSDRRWVPGYGDANADFHVIGNHPGVHGGTDRGIPFTGSEAGAALLDVLSETGFLRRTGGDPELKDCFLSYLHCCCVPPDETPSPTAYAEFEPFFDAELRAISAHVLLPVGRRATEHVLIEYTARETALEAGMATLHATELLGRGFLVVPIRDPGRWAEGDREAIVEAIGAIRGRDYRRTVDLGRFNADGEPYFVR